MPKTSAGILLYRRRDALEVLLVHPGGPFWRDKDAGSWSLPKGEFEEGEAALDAARREFQEETGFPATGPFLPLQALRQKSGKIIQAWAAVGDLEAASIRSSTFSIEWPPHSGRRQTFPEVDRAGWFRMDEARRRIHPGQAAFLAELERRLSI